MKKYDLVICRILEIFLDMRVLRKPTQQRYISPEDIVLSVAAGEHAALDVEVSITSGVPTEQPGLVSVIYSQSVTVAQSQVSVLVPDCSCK